MVGEVVLLGNWGFRGVPSQGTVPATTEWTTGFCSEDKEWHGFKQQQ